MIHPIKSPKTVQQEIQQQASKLLTQIAGYVGVRTVELGLRFGIIVEIANHPQGISADDLARQTTLDPFYVGVWCRSAYAAEVLEMGEKQSYKLAPYLDKLLLDRDFPGYIGGIPQIMEQPEVFDCFAENFASGQHSWWDQFSPTFIQAVSATALPFYTRLIPDGLSKISGLSERLVAGSHILELACGTGTGLLKLAHAYPHSTLVGVDGDAYSLEVAADRLCQHGVYERVSPVRKMLEEIDEAEAYDLVVINVSMHECRNMERVTDNVRRALKPGGYFVISDFPFPDTLEGCRTVPGRIMCGIQFAEAVIDDQLLPTRAFVYLLSKHDFRNVGSFDLAPVHAVTYGQK